MTGDDWRDQRKRDREEPPDPQSSQGHAPETTGEPGKGHARTGATHSDERDECVRTASDRVRIDHDLRQAVEERLNTRREDTRRRRALRERARAEKTARRAAGLEARHARKISRFNRKDNP